MLDALSELGTLDPWLLRGWRYIFSSRYRAKRHAGWANSSSAAVVVDVVLTLAVMIVEIVVVYWIVAMVLGNWGAI